MDEELRINSRPLQRPDTDNLIRTTEIAGPSSSGDRRMYLSASVLDSLLAIAKESQTKRVQLDRVGVRVDLYEGEGGHTYEVWSFTSSQPRPEALPFLVGGQ